jgi:hypothetical protein
MVATSSRDELSVETKPEEVGVGWAVVVFQKCLPGPVSLHASPRPSKKPVAERVERYMTMVEECSRENSLGLVEGGSRSYLEPKAKMFYS